ncbi:hypothetical protein P6144_17575 [Sphingomonas sp. HITSZ_GF]|uniref:surface-adhesin E family protein n=1 Tax=Sphingomonas sp. HITSZ_GF TaxID=3037247 RepID=UPI00240D41E8|nr:surface-adhesin E family protein [Sphingomonas sp. HITSZ_GF]MDG2535476.1 hypothetical protein [Sphingomonas sp. HITSZ_GF]
MILGIALALAGQAVPDWRPIGYLGEGDAETVAYVDAAGIASPDPNTREATVLTVYFWKQYDAEERAYDVVRTRWRIDCAARTGQAVTATAMLGNRDIAALKVEAGIEPFEGDHPFARVAQLACGDDQTAVRSKVTGNLLLDAAERFGWQALARESMTKANWHRVDATIIGGKRLALFLDRDSVVRQPDGRYLVMTMQVDEGVSTAQRFNYATLIDCTARLRINVYSEYYRTDGTYVGKVIPRNPNQPLSGRFVGYLAPPVCSGDWSKTRAFAGTAAEIAASAAALEPEPEAN